MSPRDDISDDQDPSDEDGQEFEDLDRDEDETGRALLVGVRPSGEKIGISDLTDQFVKVNPAETAQPKKDNVKVYQDLQALQDETSKSLRGVFGQHRKFVLGRS